MRTGVALLISFITAAIVVSSIGMLLRVASEITMPTLAQGPADIGKTIYGDKCLSCHAEDGSGNVARGKVMKVPDLRKLEIQQKSDDQLFADIAKSAAHKGVRKQISDEKLRMVVVHLRTLKK